MKYYQFIGWSHYRLTGTIGTAPRRD